MSGLTTFLWLASYPQTPKGIFANT